VIVVPVDLLEAADHLRLLGNDAAHVKATTYDNIGQRLSRKPSWRGKARRWSWGGLLNLAQAIAHFAGEALGGAVDTDHHLGQDGELVLDRADAVEHALDLAGEEVEVASGMGRACRECGWVSGRQRSGAPIGRQGPTASGLSLFVALCVGFGSNHLSQ
jgi:hypothetical protein